MLWTRASGIVAALLACRVMARDDNIPDGSFLPDVDVIMSSANDQMNEFTSQAKIMQQNAVDADRKARDALAQERADYQQKLADQTQTSKDIEKENHAIRTSISTLERGNKNLRQDARNIKQSNALMFQALKTLNPKIHTAQLYLDDALKMAAIEESNEQLQVLEKPKPEPTLDHFLEVVRSDMSKMQDDIKDEVSLLGMASERNTGSKPKHGGAEDMVPMLSQHLEDLETSESEGRTKMKAQFLALYEMGEMQRKKLLDVQADLRAGQAAAVALQSELHTAKAHLKDKSKELKDRLKGLGLYAERSKMLAVNALQASEMVNQARETVGVSSAEKPASNATAK